MINNYNHFLIKENFKLILEANLEILPKLMDILQKMDSPVAQFILSLKDNDLDTDINNLDISEKPGNIDFYPQKKLEKDPENIEKYRQSGKSGRVVNKILKLVEQEFDPKDIEKFSNEFKAKMEQLEEETELVLVKGEDIRFWYDCINYAPNGGTLNSSCMRYSKCQKYLDIYVKNPDVCQLLILKSKEDPNLIEARALVWKLDDGNTFMDRVYYTSDYMVEIYLDYAKKNGWFYKDGQNSDYNNIVDSEGNDIELVKINVLPKDKYLYFPYMDTIKCWIDDDVIANTGGEYEMESTDGGDGSCDTCGGSGEMTCSDCDGNGDVTCYECDGDGDVTCSDCDGEGNYECGRCDASGEEDCSECGGSGEMTCSECDGDGEIDGESCSECDGSGLEGCDDCNSSGKVECSACSGEGDIECDECSGRGHISCSHCGGDGNYECGECYGNGVVTCYDCN